MPPLYTLREVARNLNVSRSTLWRMVKAGLVPHSRVGKQIRFDILAVRAMLDRHR
jgi:excisionase family DNA binding protein